jgi:hypothetical protein
MATSSRYVQGSFILALHDEIFMSHVWPLLSTPNHMMLPSSLQEWGHVSQSWKYMFHSFESWRCVSQSWNGLVDTHVLSLAYQVSHFDVTTQLSQTWTQVLTTSF